MKAMTYDVSDAVKIMQHYHFLEGSLLTENLDVSTLCIVPADADRQAAFFWHLNQHSMCAQALIYSGYKAGAVKIMLIHQDKNPGNFFTRDLDDYLDEKHIFKLYDQHGKFRDRPIAE